MDRQGIDLRNEFKDINQKLPGNLLKAAVKYVDQLHLYKFENIDTSGDMRFTFYSKKINMDGISIVGLVKNGNITYVDNVFSNGKFLNPCFANKIETPINVIRNKAKSLKGTTDVCLFISFILIYSGFVNILERNYKEIR